ncbi:MAG: hypothetical protein ACPGWR_00415 [Ardenticatenaceae bacterium]
MTYSQSSELWHNCEASLWDKRVVLMGGAGFLGSFVPGCMIKCVTTSE